MFFFFCFVGLVVFVPTTQLSLAAIGNMEINEYVSVF